MSARRLIGDEGSLCDLVYLSQYEDLIYAITGNVTTPYYFGAYDLDVHGALVVEDPAGMSAGFIQDLRQRPVVDLGVPGVLHGAGGKLLIAPPGEAVPDEVAGFHVVRSRSNMVVPLLRNLETDTDRAAAVTDAFRIYPYAQRDDPPPTGIVPCEGREWATNQPRGLSYWEALSEAIDNGPVEERDRFFHAMLKPLGIEKGQPFAPTERQKAILEEAVFVGEPMAIAIAFERRDGLGHYADGTNWTIALTTSTTQRENNYDHLDERTAWCYEAYSTSDGMTTTSPGVGSIYLDCYRDADGRSLDGAESYRLRVSAGVPVKNFWSVTVYNNDTRYPITNDQRIADRSSRMDLVENDDGTIDIWFGPTAPTDKEQNWIPTNPDQSWFPYFRLYGPLEAYFDRSWVLPSIERIGEPS
jgi:hypothetical protein